MVKGRGPTIFDSGVSLVTSSSRSYIDDDDLGYEPVVNLSKAKRISNFANDDFDAVRSQSRRHDAALLNSITNRVPTGRRTVTTTRPSTPVTTARATYRAASEPPGRGLTPSADLAVRQAKRSLNRIEGELGTGGSPSYHHHHHSYGGGSVGGGYGSYGGGSVGGGYGSYGGYHHRQPAVEETVIRTTSVPRTGSMHSVPRRAMPVSRTFRAGSLPPPSSRGTHRPLPARHRVDLDLEADIESQIIPASMARPPPSVSGLRSRATEAKNKLDAHRSMLDRYLPIYMGPEADVADEVRYKYGELVQRIPRLEPYRPNRDPSGIYSSSSTGVVPYRRASLPPRPGSHMDSSLRRPPPMTPRVSDTRKRAREVLCKTKKDPHYFDY